jgi:hypothetical protein
MVSAMAIHPRPPVMSCTHIRTAPTERWSSNSLCWLHESVPGTSATRSDVRQCDAIGGIAEVARAGGISRN